MSSRPDEGSDSAASRDDNQSVVEAVQVVDEDTRQELARLISPESRALNIAGLVFIYIGGLTLFFGVVTGVYLGLQGRAVIGAAEFFSYYGISLMLIGAAALFSIFGYLILRSVGTANRQVIPVQDRELLTDLIRKGDNKGIDTYVRLSALSGAAGFFHKIGVSGLPLATVFLSIVFAILALTPLGGQQTAFADLAKLTLGAFLGSYVQRQQDQPTMQPATTEQPKTATPEGTN